MIVIKLGGHAMSEGSNWAEPIAARWASQGALVIVHGGGPQINKALTANGLESNFIEGLRVTSESGMKIVEATLTGQVLRSVVADLVAQGIPAVGISGRDGGVIRANFKDKTKFGFVGEVVKVDTKLLTTLLDAGFLPVVSPVGVTEDGEALNVNGDTAAGAIAGALCADEIIYLTDVAGIYREWPNPESLMSEITLAELSKMEFEGGMAPKVAAVTKAIESGAKAARVIDGREAASLRSALAQTGGTLVRK